MYTHARTDARTDGPEFKGPHGFQPGTNKTRQDGPRDNQISIVVTKRMVEEHSAKSVVGYFAKKIPHK